MAQQTAVMKLLAWMDEQGYHVEYEMEQSFLDLEKEQIIQFADRYADDVMGGCNLRAEQYYNETYEGKNNS